MPEREDYENWIHGRAPDENDSVYDEELETDWGKSFDDLDPSFWEKYYGGSDTAFDEENSIKEVEDDEYKDEVEVEDEETEEKNLEVLLDEYVTINQNLENLKDQYEELREEITERLADEQVITHEGFRIRVGFSKTWEFSDDLRKLIEKVKIEKKHEIETGIAKLKSINRYLKGQKTQAKVREEYPRAYIPWSKEEDEALKILSEKRVPISEISQIHQRQKNAIRIRINNLRRNE